MPKIGFVKDRSWAKDAARELGLKRELKDTSRKPSNNQEVRILNKSADYLESIKTAQQQNKVLLTLKGLIIALKNDPALFEKLETKSFWILDSPIFGILQYSKIDYLRGCLVKTSLEEWQKLPAHEKAFVWDDSTKGPLLIKIDGDGLHINRPQIDSFAARVVYTNSDDPKTMNLKISNLEHLIGLARRYEEKAGIPALRHAASIREECANLFRQLEMPEKAKEQFKLAAQSWKDYLDPYRLDEQIKKSNGRTAPNFQHLAKCAKRFAYDLANSQDEEEAINQYARAANYYIEEANRVELAGDARTGAELRKKASELLALRNEMKISLAKHIK